MQRLYGNDVLIKTSSLEDKRTLFSKYSVPISVIFGFSALLFFKRMGSVPVMRSTPAPLVKTSANVQDIKDEVL